MKLCILVLSLFLCVGIYAQEKEIASNAFVRVYDLNGKKMAKGKLFSTSETDLVLKKSKKLLTIRMATIGFIKTKRSMGNNVLIGSAVGAGTVIIVSAGSDESFTEGYTGLGTLVFTGMGAGVGAITSIFKNSRTYQIDGDSQKWEAFRVLMSNTSD